MAVTSSADRHSPPPVTGQGTSARTWPWWLAVTAALGSLALLESGGVDLRVPLLRVSAHNPRPLAYAAAFIALAALFWRRQLTWATDLPALAADVRRRANLWVSTLAIGVAVVAVMWNTWTIGGSDSTAMPRRLARFPRAGFTSANHLRSRRPGLTRRARSRRSGFCPHHRCQESSSRSAPPASRLSSRRSSGSGPPRSSGLHDCPPRFLCGRHLAWVVPWTMAWGVLRPRYSPPRHRSFCTRPSSR